jgi:sugar-specific transcriptional regulator TrmB
MELLSVLRKVGLTENEGKTYLCLIKEGSLPVGEISKKTNLHRRNVYDILNRLQEKGFVSYIKKNNVNLFQATNPRKIKEEIEEQKKEFEKELPSLEKIYSSLKEKQDIRVFYGKEGLKNVFQDQLIDNDSSEIKIIGASSNAYEIFPFYFKWYDLDRVKKKIKIKAISSNKLKKIPFSEIKYFPQKYENPLAINIYKNKVALILWNSDNPMAIVIENKEIIESYKKYFEFTWKNSKKS